MSRSGYVDDFCEYWNVIRWRGAVASAVRGRRGQAFLREMLAALDALPDKKLCDGRIVIDGPDEFGDLADEDERDPVAFGACCAIGSVALARGEEAVARDVLDPGDSHSLAKHFGIANALVCEIEYVNDELAPTDPHERWAYVRQWVSEHIDKSTKKEGSLS